MHLLCEDPDVIGTTFFVMEHVEGRVLWDGSLPGQSPEQRRAIHAEMLRVLAALHRVDPDEVGLGDYGRRGNYFARQLSTWTRQYRASETGTIDAMEKLIDWLPAHIPDDDSVGIAHGDYRLDNMIFAADEPRVCALLDWELSTLGHPLADLAYLCMAYHLRTPYSPCLAPLAGPESGIPTEGEVLAEYCRMTGRDEIPNWPFYIAFSIFRLAAILQGVYKRGLDGNASSTRALELGALVEGGAAVAWRLVR